MWRVSLCGTGCMYGGCESCPCVVGEYVEAV